MHAEFVQPSGWLQYLLPLAIFAVIFAFRIRRMSQERPLKLERLWVIPAIFVLLFVGTLYATPPRGLGWLWVALALPIGAAIGWWRGTSVRIAVDPLTHALNQRASPLAIIVLVLLVALKQAARYEGGALHTDVATLSDALLALATGTFAVMRLEMYLRGRRLLAAARAAGPASSVPGARVE